ncbi:uncharacterized protein LOC125226157 [Leguminivora glycinivorella]|uniref:uncharacterized protein LOC125226157 n=1 Tax=Leguminivora glycinivorella TaxID=1035111 RepID=UPI00200EF90F|nr:uncharacterized protein LOC125226157 [Leguminivora glycinivorella]
MSFQLFCSIITLATWNYGVLGLFNKDVVCILDRDEEPVCKALRRNNVEKIPTDDFTPVYDPYIPRSNVKLYNCTETECKSLKLESISQITSPTMFLQSCFLKSPEKYECEKIRYNYLKNIDKLLFLSNTIPDKQFYMVDCLVYKKGERICHSKTSPDTHVKLIDAGNTANPNKSGILSQDEFICQQSSEGEVLCDLNPYIPFPMGLRFKEVPSIVPEILLKTTTFFVTLKLKCWKPWCGYQGLVLRTRRQFPYRPPGGDIYRCFYAKRQQICKKISNIYEERGSMVDE